MTDTALRFRDVMSHDSTEIGQLASATVTNAFETFEALVHPQPVARAVREATLKAICAALDIEGIDYFAVPGFAPFGSVIGVEDTQREATIRAIRRLGEQTALPAQIAQTTPTPKISHAGQTTAEPRLAARLDSAKVIKVWWRIADPSLSHVFGASHGVEIEFWQQEQWREGVHSFTGLTDEERQNRLQAPRPNRATKMIERDSAETKIDIDEFSYSNGAYGRGEHSIRTRSQLAHPLPDDVRFPIDVVYTWVDGNDAEWSAKRAKYTGEPSHRESDSASRFVNRDELKYSLRSLFANAPWVNRVFIVTDGQHPSWLKSGAGIEIVDHRDIFPDPSVLPVFNSHAIEANLHRIPGLSEHFLYFNDDMFIGRPVSPTKFFYPNGTAKHFPSMSRVPYTAPSPRDTPVDAATKNVRRLIEREFAVSIGQVMEHAPYAMRRSVLEEMSERFSPEFIETSRARFRSASDVNVPSNFAHHYGFQVAKSVPSSLAFTYIGLSVKDLQLRLDRLLTRRDMDAFCLNDTFTTGAELEAQLEVVMPFLEAYFPIAAPWEK